MTYSFSIEYRKKENLCYICSSCVYQEIVEPKACVQVRAFHRYIERLNSLLVFFSVFLCEFRLRQATFSCTLLCESIASLALPVKVLWSFEYIWVCTVCVRSLVAVSRASECYSYVAFLNGSNRRLIVSRCVFFRYIFFSFFFVCCRFVFLENKQVCVGRRMSKRQRAWRKT